MCQISKNYPQNCTQSDNKCANMFLKHFPLYLRDLVIHMGDQAPVVQRVDNAIHRINHYPVDSVVCFANTYPLDSDLSGG